MDLLKLCRMLEMNKLYKCCISHYNICFPPSTIFTQIISPAKQNSCREPCHITSCHIMPYHNTLSHVTSQNSISHHVTSHTRENEMKQKKQQKKIYILSFFSKKNKLYNQTKSANNEQPLVWSKGQLCCIQRLQPSARSYKKFS